MRRHGVQGPDRHLRAAGPVRSHPRDDSREAADLRDQEGGAGRRDAIPARVRRRARDGGHHDAARDQQGDVRRMSVLASLRDTSGPNVAVELASHRVSAATLEFHGGQPVIAAHAVEHLPAGLLIPSLTGEKIPSRAQDLDQLVRWQVRKTAPFPIEEAQVSYVRGLHAPDGQDFIVSLARRTVVEEYERLCADAGSHAGLVDLATFNVINAVLAAPARPVADWLLVNVATDYASIAIVRGEHLIFFRNREAEGDGTLADLVHQSAMYYEDRLKGGGFARVILAGGGQQAADVDQ